MLLSGGILSIWPNRKGHPYPESKLCLQTFCFLSHLFLHLYLFSLRLILCCPELRYLCSMVFSCLGRFSVVLKWLLHGQIPSRCFSLAMRLLHLWCISQQLRHSSRLASSYYFFEARHTECNVTTCITHSEYKASHLVH